MVEPLRHRQTKEAATDASHSDSTLAELGDRLSRHRKNIAGVKVSPLKTEDDLRH